MKQKFGFTKKQSWNLGKSNAFCQLNNKFVKNLKKISVLIFLGVNAQAQNFFNISDTEKTKKS
jgi:hypothetical protein